MTTPIYVLCSNFTENGRREVGETMRCFDDEKFLPPFFAHLGEGAKSLQGACHLTLRLPVKFRPNRFRFAGVIPEKVIP